MKKAFFTLMIVWCMILSFTVPIQADENGGNITELSVIMKAENETTARKTPNEQAEAVHVYDSGAPVYVTGETGEGWYRILYQDKEGYVLVSELTEQDMDISELDKEMEAMEAESKLVVEEVERYRSETKRSRIWGTVIVLLVVGIFATGIISTVKTGKYGKKDM